MPNYPYNVNRTYVNPEGNLAASGDYYSHVTQELANMFPKWMHLRDNKNSVGQQFLSPAAVSLHTLEDKMNDLFKSKFISTAPVDEIDVIYRTKIPSNVNLTNASASGVRCITAPSGIHPSGVGNIWVEEINTLEEFYYNVLPTRLNVVASGCYVSSIDDEEWHTKPSGVLDLFNKQVDVWKTKHDITWCYADGYFRKQDRETLEDYETYQLNSGYGTPLDIYYYKNILWWVGKDGSDYYFNLTNTKTKTPKEDELDLLASFDITDAFGIEPSGILIDEEGIINICDTQKTRVFAVKPVYDYFILDKDNRYLYFREDYTDPGVFVSNT